MTRVSTLLLASSLACAGLALPARAQSTPAEPATPPAASASTPPVAAPASVDVQEDVRKRARAADRGAFFEAHMAALRAGLMLTTEQEKLWPAVEQAIRGYVAVRADLRDRHADAAQDGADAIGEDNPIAELKSYSEALLRRAQALNALSGAAEPLFNALDDGQKRRLPTLLRDLVPGRGPVARMVERLARSEDEPDAVQGGDDRDSNRDRPPGRRGGWHDRHAEGWRDGERGGRAGMRQDGDGDMALHDGESWTRRQGGRADPEPSRRSSDDE